MPHFHFSKSKWDIGSSPQVASPGGGWRVEGGKQGGALDGGRPMSHVDFKKWQSSMSLSLIFPNVICRI